MTIPTFEDWHKDHAKYMEPADIVHWCKDAYEAGKRDAVPEWISVEDRLPEERAKPYQLIVICTKKMEGMYQDRGIRRFIQDWTVRRWPQNFTHWIEAMPLPAAPKGD